MVILRRRCLLVALLEAPWPVRDTADHHAHVDEIKFVLIFPWFFDVIDLELTVWWNAVTFSDSP